MTLGSRRPGHALADVHRLAEQLFGAPMVSGLMQDESELVQPGRQGAWRRSGLASTKAHRFLEQRLCLVVSARQAQHPPERLERRRDVVDGRVQAASPGEGLFQPLLCGRMIPLVGIDLAEPVQRFGLGQGVVTRRRALQVERARQDADGRIVQTEIGVHAPEHVEQGRLRGGVVGELRSDSRRRLIEELARGNRVAPAGGRIRELEEICDKVGDARCAVGFDARAIPFDPDRSRLKTREYGKQRRDHEQRRHHADADSMPSGELSESIRRGVGLRDDGAAFEEAAEIIGQLSRRRVAPIRLVPERLEHDPIEVAIEAIDQSPAGRSPRVRDACNGLAVGVGR